MKSLLQLIIVVVITSVTFAQVDNYTRFSGQDESNSIMYSASVQTGSGEILFFWAEENILYSSRSVDYGVTWTPKGVLANDVYVPLSGLGTPDINSIRLPDNRILLFYKTNGHVVRYSDDDGYNWSEAIQLPTSTDNTAKYYGASSVSVDQNETIHFIYSDLFGELLKYTTWEITSTDGVNWSDDRITILATENFQRSGNVDVVFSENNSIAVYQIYNENNYDIYLGQYMDGNIVNGVPFLNSEMNETNPTLKMDDSGKLWLFYETEKQTSIESLVTKDIMYIISTDEGQTWTDPISVTDFGGYDNNYYAAMTDSEPFISFSTIRPTSLMKLRENDYRFYDESYSSQLYFGSVGFSLDNITPPEIWEGRAEFSLDYPYINIDITASLLEDDISNVWVELTTKNSELTVLQLLDDGNNSDETAGDFIFSGNISYEAEGFDTLWAMFHADDEFGNTIVSEIVTFYGELDLSNSITWLDVNKIKLQINNSGITAYRPPQNNFEPPGLFDESYFLFAGGFQISGLNNQKIWSNGAWRSNGDVCYQAGQVGSNPMDLRNSLFAIKSTDTPFGDGWQSWAYAVEMGANFYDGNGDGNYNPVDLNGNGQWDVDEDRPDLIGDLTVWCVYNDGADLSQRFFPDTEPLGIEIRQTAFAYSGESVPELQNTIFLRYEIENTGMINTTLDSVYFSVRTDPDIGKYDDDLVASDTSLQSSFTYNDGPDDFFGNNSPAFFTTILQGPQFSKAGQTFVDINENGIFDEGIDTALDSAAINRGSVLGKLEIPGSKNLGMISFMHAISSHPTVGDPYSETTIYNYMKGLDKNGNTLNPCTWGFGEVKGGVDCNSINPYFWYNGDPVSNHGWINTTPDDQKMLTTSGPFQLIKNEPIEIIVAYSVGRGSSPVESIDVTREIVKNVTGFYSTNFAYIPTSVEETTNNQQPTTFNLEQNYPNPFNPTTTIKYTIPSNLKRDTKNVKLIIYDILGREIQTLVDTKLSPGNYEVEFNASKLASGVYFYQLNAGYFISTKKMMLIK